MPQQVEVSNCQHGNDSASCKVCIAWNTPAETTFTTISGLTVRKGQTRNQAQAEADEQLDWIHTYGRPEYGGWRFDPVDGKHKPAEEIKRKGN